MGERLERPVRGASAVVDASGTPAVDPGAGPETLRAGSGSPGSRGGRILGALLPGGPQLLAGRWGTGGFALGTWLFLWAVLVLRHERVATAPAGGTGARLALATLLLGIVATWAWSYHDLSGSRPVVRPGGQWSLTVRAFRRNRLAVLGLMAIGAVYLVALLAPFLAPFDPALQGDLLTERYLGPSAAHPLGTDGFARDVLSRILFGARISLTIGFVAVAISVTIGTLVGAVAGYLGGVVDSILMRFVDTVISFPRLVLLITIIALFDPDIFLIVAVLGLTQWPGPARIVRGEVLSLREREFVQAARALGFSRTRIVLRHLIPNAMGPVIVAATLGIGNTIVLEAGLSFLGLGIQPPHPSWGSMVDAGRDQLLGAWWVSTFPGLAIVLTVLSFNLAGDGLRDALDPRLRA